MAGIAAVLGAMAGPVFGMFNTAVRNRTQWEFLRGQAEELRIQAAQAQDIGAAEIRNFVRTSSYRRGAIVAGWGASGLDANSGSAFESLLAQSGFDALQKLQMKRSTAIQVRNLETQAVWTDYSRKILDVQLPLQLLGAGLQGASGAGASFGAAFGGSGAGTMKAAAAGG